MPTEDDLSWNTRRSLALFPACPAATRSRGSGPSASRLAAGSAAARRAAAQGPITLRWWSPQSAPAQLAAYRAQIASFEAAHPGIKVSFEPTSDEGYPAQLSAAFASEQVPNVVTHLPSFAVSNYWRNGLVEPFNDVIQAIGPQNYYEGANRVYEIDRGQFAGTGIGSTRGQHALGAPRPHGEGRHRQDPGDLGRAAERVPEAADRRRLRGAAAVRRATR